MLQYMDTASQGAIADSIRYFYCNIVIYICCVLFSLETQRNGLVFIYDMTHSKYLNFDYELSIKILSMLKVILVRVYCFCFGYAN